jgi:hypothetical protein
MYGLSLETGRVRANMFETWVYYGSLLRMLIVGFLLIPGIRPQAPK